MITPAETPEETLWRSVIVRFVLDVRNTEVYIKKAHDQFELTQDEERLKWGQKYQYHIGQMETLMHELASDYMEDVCDQAGFDYPKFKRKVITALDVDLPVIYGPRSCSLN